MQIAGKRIGMTKVPVLPVFCIGVVAGILVMNMGKSVLLKGTGLFDEDTLYHMKYMTIDSRAFFFYIFRKRILVVLGMAALCTTYLGLVVCAGAVGWYGMAAGAYLSALALRYGFKGILLSLVGVFPQYLLYVPAMLALLGWCESLYKGIYSRSISAELAEKGFLPGKVGKLALILGVVILGCYLEAYVNPKFLLGYLKVF